jgi:hypothetical protein
MDTAREDEATNNELSSNVVSLQEQRELRTAKAAEQAQTESIAASLSCEDGVCMVLWKPQRPAA